MRKTGNYKDRDHERDHLAIVAEVNRFSPEPIPVSIVTPLTEVAIPHGFDVVPTFFFSVVTPTTTGMDILLPGPTPWTATNIYVQSPTAPGLFHIIVRK